MHIKQSDRVLHLSFGDDAYPRANAFCGAFSKRQIADRVYQNLDPHAKPNLPFEDKEFDVVYSTQVLQYVSDPAGMLAEIRRVGKSAHIREYTEFAEMLFGWPEHIWVMDLEGNQLVIRRKNPKRYGRFGPYFHRLYSEEPVFCDFLQRNESMMKLKLDWYDKDDRIVVVTSDPNIEKTENSVPEIRNKNIDIEDIEDIEIPVVLEENKTEQLDNMESNIIMVFRPTESEYFDHDRFVLGEIVVLEDIV
jgi:SAM-dependent methyltransferase